MVSDGAKVIPLYAETHRHEPAIRRRSVQPSETDTFAPVSSLAERRGGGGGPGELVDGVRRSLAKQITGAASFVRRRLAGDYPIDEFGYDEHLSESVFLPAFRPAFQRWFRVEVSGIENLPETGAALVVANHAGVLPIDGLMTQIAVHDHHPKHRALRMLAADLVFETPFLGTAARKAGHTLAC
ncbi:MAG: 1-acyl-sn-glycerol-3-phosphate acyltransferase, partial [Aldersonia sp.]|nr:1-acyl-sn-glycerol-3-phosphate acyltransferase [Aldersonia sp.]